MKKTQEEKNKKANNIPKEEINSLVIIFHSPLENIDFKDIINDNFTILNFLMKINNIKIIKKIIINYNFYQDKIINIIKDKVLLKIKWKENNNIFFQLE